MPHILTLFSAQIQVCVKSIAKKQFASFESNGMTYDESCELFNDCTIVDGAVFDERVVINLDGKDVTDSQKLLAVLIKKARKNALTARKKTRALNKTQLLKKQHYAVSTGHIKRSWSTLEIKSVFDPAKLDVLVEITEVVGMADPVETFQVLYEQTQLEFDENDGVRDWDNYLVSDTGKIFAFVINDEDE